MLWSFDNGLQEFAKRLQREEYEAKKKRQASQQQQRQQQQEPEDDAVSSSTYIVCHTSLTFAYQALYFFDPLPFLHNVCSPFNIRALESTHLNLDLYCENTLMMFDYASILTSPLHYTRRWLSDSKRKR